MSGRRLMMLVCVAALAAAPAASASAGGARGGVRRLRRSCVTVWPGDEFPTGLPGELAAGRIDVAASRQPDGRPQPVLLQRGAERVDRTPRRALVRRVGGVVRDE